MFEAASVSSMSEIGEMQVERVPFKTNTCSLRLRGFVASRRFTSHGHHKLALTGMKHKTFFIFGGDVQGQSH